MRTAKEQREIRFIYNKHNKSTKYKLEIDDNRIVFPENIRLIINKREKRTNEEAEELNIWELLTASLYPYGKTLYPVLTYQ